MLSGIGDSGTNASASKKQPSSHLAYVAWFLSATTLTYVKGDSKKPLFEEKLRSSIQRASKFLSEAFTQTKSGHRPEIRTWLCRIISLLVYRSAFMLQYYKDDRNRRDVLNTLVNAIAPHVSFTIFDTINELIKLN